MLDFTVLKLLLDLNLAKTCTKSYRKKIIIILTHKAL